MTPPLAEAGIPINGPRGGSLLDSQLPGSRGWPSAYHPPGLPQLPPPPLPAPQQAPWPEYHPAAGQGSPLRTAYAPPGASGAGSPPWIGVQQQQPLALQHPIRDHLGSVPISRVSPRRSQGAPEPAAAGGLSNFESSWTRDGGGRSQRGGAGLPAPGGSGEGADPLAPFASSWGGSQQGPLFTPDADPRTAAVRRSQGPEAALITPGASHLSPHGSAHYAHSQGGLPYGHRHSSPLQHISPQRLTQHSVPSFFGSTPGGAAPPVTPLAPQGLTGDELRAALRSQGSGGDSSSDGAPASSAINRILELAEEVGLSPPRLFRMGDEVAAPAAGGAPAVGTVVGLHGEDPDAQLVLVSFPPEDDDCEPTEDWVPAGQLEHHDPVPCPLPSGSLRGLRALQGAMRPPDGPPASRVIVISLLGWPVDLIALVIALAPSAGCRPTARSSSPPPRPAPGGTAGRGGGGPLRRRRALPT
eukprot:TRINITY_DN10487_c0_g1_i2.p1 TRINITY_DN10487_c0_g1~~TRINITY_DN10487_c0_g1_i2.p1  ORF type:complete len:501 (+),score=66.50 TRINITY_DN10487_c0_g1_i2:91-1503(+)